MPLIHDTALVLRRLDFSESSQVLAILTRGHGKVRLIAKGIRRGTRTRFNPGIDLLESGDVVFSVRTPSQEALATMTEWTQTEAFLGLRESLSRLRAAQYIADLAAALTEDWDPHPQVFDGAQIALHLLCTAAEPLGPILDFQRLLLQETGHAPCLDRCVSCNRPVTATRDLYFSSFEGGVLCRDCEPSRLEKRLVTVSRQALQNGQPASAADVAAFFDLLNYHITHLMGREPVAAGSLVALVNASRSPTPQ